uniref:Uncharacterized protein n=1 Tax=Rhizophora mucronata TaxID=61149 RepID=A0A2P2J286_RHIMU
MPEQFNSVPSFHLFYHSSSFCLLYPALVIILHAWLRNIFFSVLFQWAISSLLFRGCRRSTIMLL